MALSPPAQIDDLSSQIGAVEDVVDGHIVAFEGAVASAVTGLAQAVVGPPMEGAVADGSDPAEYYYL